MTATEFAAAPFLAVCPNYFGRGFTVDEAKKNMKAQGGTLARYVVYRLPEGAERAYVNDWGLLSWEWTSESAKTEFAESGGTVEIVAKRGV